MVAPWQIHGLFQPVLLVTICRPSMLFVQVVGESPDADDGKHLRARYLFDAKPMRPAISGLGGGPTDAPLEVEFDLAGGLQLNWPGSVYMTGGNVENEYAVRTTLVDAPFCLTWHPLTAFVSGLEYVIPEYHSRIRATQAVDYTQGGNSGTLDHQPIPVCAGGKVTLAVAGKTIITEWWG